MKAEHLTMDLFLADLEREEAINQTRKRITMGHVDLLRSFRYDTIASSDKKALTFLRGNGICSRG